MTSGARRDCMIVLLGLVVAAGIARVLVDQPALAIMGVVAGTLALAFVVLPLPFDRIVLVCLGIVLIGYAFFGRAFAYLRVGPLFIGEVVLCLGLLGVLTHRKRGAALQSPLGWLLIVYMCWGAACTIPYLGTYGTMALRDAVLWGYGWFAIMVLTLMRRSRWLALVPELYGRWFPRLLLWIPLGLLFTRAADRYLPIDHGDSAPLDFVKAGDAGVHLAGIAVFVALGLYSGRTSLMSTSRQGFPWFVWALWSLGFAFVASINRGGLLAVVTAMSVIVALRPVEIAPRIIRGMGVAGCLAIGLIVFDFSLDVGRGRTISPRQVAMNSLSISGHGGASELEGTRRWRLTWWEEIVAYTVGGDYFWTGKGFGINLADDDGFQLSSGTLRSPHNGHVTVLARTGVPGIILWGALQIGYGVSLVASGRRARRRGDERWSRLTFWVLAYWMAALVNSSFDVYLEGPQGGIWFWCVFGLGLALMDTEKLRQVKSSPVITRAYAGAA